MSEAPSSQSARPSEQTTASRGGWTKQPEEVRRRAIVDAACRCFAEKGYANTSVQHIARQAGLTKGGVYFHFESKEAIRDALIAHYTDPQRFALETEECLALPADQRLHVQIERYLAGLRSEGNAGLLTLAEAATRDGAGIPRIRGFFLAIAGMLVRTITAGQQSGVFARRVEPAVQAELILATLHGLALHVEFDDAGVNLCSGHQRVLSVLVDQMRAVRGRD